MGRGGSMGLQGRELGINGAGWQYGVTGKGARHQGGGVAVWGYREGS